MKNEPGFAGHLLSNPASQGAIPSAELGRRCAQSLDPDDFEPFVRRIRDDVYDRLLETVQTYLVENTEWNIRAKLDAAEREVRRLRMERDHFELAVEYAHSQGFEWPTDPFVVPVDAG